MTNAQNSEHPAVILEKQNLKPIESVTDEQGREIDKETKALRIDRKSEAIEAEAIAFSFLQAKHEVYGLRSNLNDFKISGIVESPAGQYVYYRQYVNDIPVFATNFF